MSSKVSFSYFTAPDRLRVWIFIVLVFFIVYLVFLIVRSEVQDIRRTNKMQSIQAANEQTQKDIQNLRERLTLLQTRAYRDRFNKQTQNRKDPFEQVIVLVSEKTAKTYPKLDVAKIVTERSAVTAPSPTLGMTNFQKWLYYLTRGYFRSF